jgi:hypothetical protein
MPVATRQRAHAALARVLANHPDRAVWHRASPVSGRDEQIAAELEHAAGDAQRRGAVTAAAAWLERAAALSPDQVEQIKTQVPGCVPGTDGYRCRSPLQSLAPVAGATTAVCDRHDPQPGPEE